MIRSLDPMPSVAELRRMYRERTGKDPEMCAPDTTTPRYLRIVGGMFADPYRSKLEREYAARLDAMQRAGLIAAWQYEPRTFTVGVRRHYTPDFRVVHRDPMRVEYHECKGSARAKNARDSLTRLAVVALHHPRLTFYLVTRTRGEWAQKLIAA